MTSAPTYAVHPKLRRCDWSNTPPATLLAFFELASVGGVLNGGDGHIGTINELAGGLQT